MFIDYGCSVLDIDRWTQVEKNIPHKILKLKPMNDR